MEYQYLNLPNGIRCVLHRIKSPVLYCGLTIGAGTRDEKQHEHGIAHFIEHLLFKGTTHRKAYHINTLLDNGGGELNAYTTKEETVIHATVLKSDFAKAANLISDVVFNSLFNPYDIEKECGVITDEINSYKDSPSELIFDDFEDMIFSGCSLGRSILGSKRNISRFKSNYFKEFTKRCYTTDKMVFAVVGNISTARFEAIAMASFGHIAASCRTYQVEEVPQYLPQQKTVAKGTYQTHAIIGTRGYNHIQSKRAALALLINILGGPSANSRLNNSLREKNGLSYSVEAGYTSYNNTGLASIYFGCDKENTEQCILLVEAELEKLRQVSITPSQLSTAKRQFTGQLILGQDSWESVMLAISKSLLIYNRIEQLKDITNRIDAITASELQQVAQEIFAKDRLSTLIYK